jgi:hypothetical protein
MPDYTLNIEMDENTVNEQASQGMHLFAFKAVKGPADGSGQPLVWYKTDAYGPSTQITWEKRIEAYASLDEAIPGGRIHASASYPVELGDTFIIESEHATGEVKHEGTAGAVTIRSEVHNPLTCGISQVNDVGLAPICAFPINFQFTNLFTPVEKVLVMFASDPSDLGTVIVRSFNSGLLVDLTDAPDQTRTVTFGIDGWSCGGATWCLPIPSDADLTSLLIEPSPGLDWRGSRPSPTGPRG